MASRSVSLVKQWISKNCPTFVDVVQGRPQFIVHINDGSTVQTERMFLRSSLASWGSSPQYETIVNACTAAGQDRFTSLSTARAETIAYHLGNLVVGPSAAINSLLSNVAVSTSPLAKRLYDACRVHVVPQPSPMSWPGMTAEQVYTSPTWLAITKLLASIGMEMSAPQSRVVSYAPSPNSVAMQQDMLRLHGPGKFFVTFANNADGSANGPWTHVYMYGNRPDDSCGFVGMRSFYSSVSLGEVSIPPVPSWQTSGVGVDPIAPPWFAERDAIIGSLLSSVPTGLSAPADTVSPLDSYWLPMVGIPRDQNYMVKSLVSDVEISHEFEEDYDVITVRHLVATSIGSVPVQWYIDYATAAIAKGASNSAQLAKSIESLKDNLDAIVTYAEQPSTVMLPVDMIKLTTAYRDYAKAKEKACEDNDFMSLDFTDGMTYGALNTKINGSRNTKIFYGYRESGELDTLTFDMTPNDDVVLSLGSTTVTATRGGVQFASYTAESIEAFLEMATSGASVTGGTVSSQLAIWGFSSADYELTVDGIAEVNARIKASSGYGTSTAVYDFRWGSLGISGYPLYNEVDPQTGYRLAMVSKGLLSVIGPEFRKVQMESVLQTTVRAAYPSI